MKVLIGVGGRFHADQMAKSLVGFHDVALHTTYPKSRFPDLPPGSVTSHLFSEVAYRALKALKFEVPGEHAKMLTFGSSLAFALEQDTSPDAAIVWSSFALESFRNFPKLKILVRDSAHVLFQSNILNYEYDRLGLPFANRYVGIRRELQEYAIADQIFLLSNFAKRTFIHHGVPAEKLSVIPLGVNTKLFFPREDYAPRSPLRLVYFGAISVQKGIPYLLRAFRKISPRDARLTLVGNVSPELAPYLAADNVEVKPAMPHETLSQFLRTQDVFVFPTVHDGFGQTLIQAMASGLVPITTNHCGAAELVRHGESGFVVPAQNSDALAETIGYLIKNPGRLPELSRRAREVRNLYDWPKYHATMRELVEFHLGVEGTANLAARA